MKKERVVPKRNYIYLLLMIFSVVLITLSIFSINDKYKNKRLESSYLDGFITKININEIDNVISETNSEFFILLTKTNDENVYKFEINLKKIINEYNLRDNFIYINYNEDYSCLDKINELFDIKLQKVPAILYFKNGEFVKSINSNMELLSIDDFQKLLDEYEVN